MNVDGLPGPPATSAAPIHPVAELLRGASMEISSRSGQVEDCVAHLRPGAAVSITFLPGDEWDRNIATAAALRAAGFEPILHLPTRRLANRDELASVLDRAAQTAKLRRVLLLAGDGLNRSGAFPDALAALETGLFREAGIERIDFAGYPEGHPFLDEAEGYETLAKKVERARAQGLAAGIVTQFCFEPGPIVAFLKRLDAAGVDAPVRVGLAGPAGIAALVRFALRCGIGNSLGALQRQGAQVGKLLADHGPEDVIQGVGRLLGEPAGRHVQGFHLYPFGGVPKTAAWLKTAAALAEGTWQRR